MHETDTKLLKDKAPELLVEFSEDLLSAQDFRGDLEVAVNPEKIVDVIRFLKESPSQCFEIMMDLFGMDYLKWHEKTPERFCVIYNLYSYSRKRRIRIKAFLPEKKLEIPSICGVYRAANWFEREAFDMFGIRFLGHPHLIRILCHHEFEGHPLRKDYPADGYQRLKVALPSEKL